MAGFRVIDADSHVEEPEEAYGTVGETLLSREDFDPVWAGEARENSVHEIRERTDLSEAVKRRLVSDNAARFYAI